MFLLNASERNFSKFTYVCMLYMCLYTKILRAFRFCAQLRVYFDMYLHYLYLYFRWTAGKFEKPTKNAERI